MIALGFALALFMQNTDAGTGNELNRLCKSSIDVETGICIGTISGIIGGADAVGILNGRKLFCLPANATRQQLHDTVIKYLGDHPEQRHQPDTSLVVVAIANAFPCKK